MAGLSLLAVTFGLLQPCVAGDLSPETRKTYEQTVTKGFAFLTTKGRAADGSFSSFAGPGMTALVTTAYLRHGRSANDPLVAGSLAYLQEFVQKDGGIYQPRSLYRNYETCLAIMCFQEANRDGRYDALVKGADAFVKGIQMDESEGHDPSSLAYGGSGYGTHKRPDLSNTSYMIDALHAAGNDADSEAMKRALLFVSRCQNLETAHNQTAYAAKNPDGGFYYTIAAGGSSQAGETANGGLRSYGSMTYAGLKSMIFAGVGPDDARVKAATKWIGKNYTLKTNPGLGDSGLYYYYHTFAKALAVMKVDKLADAKGVEHDWRSELIQELARRQQKDGSWINENDRWLEGDPNLVSAYALLALSYCRPTDD
jgi:squalene-hopene/tetraprenyl-beta-curcumene cyclase